MHLKHLSTDDCQALLEFETTNAKFFEQFIPARPADYFMFEPLYEIIVDLIKEQQAGKCHLHVIYEGGKIIARANLTHIDNGQASLGYRLAEDQTSNGFATQIIQQLISIAKSDYGLKQLNAITTTDNKASSRVLEKNNFEQIKIKYNAEKLNGQSVSFIYYQLGL